MLHKALHARLHEAPFLDDDEAEKRFPVSRITHPEFNLVQLFVLEVTLLPWMRRLAKKDFVF